MLVFEMNLFSCLGWNEAMWESTNQFPHIWDASWEDIGSERRVCAIAMGYDEVHWNGKHHHNSYELITAGTAGCPQEDSVTSHTECLGAADMIGYRFRENGARAWNGSPAGCFCIASSRLCYWNTNRSGPGRWDIRPLCTITPRHRYGLTTAGVAGCPQGESVTSQDECLGATANIGYRFRENGARAWPGSPAGCFCIASNGLCYWNTNRSGPGRSDISPLCDLN